MFKGDRSMKAHEMEEFFAEHGAELLAHLASKVPGASGALIILSFNSSERTPPVKVLGSAMDEEATAVLLETARDIGRPFEERARESMKTLLEALGEEGRRAAFDLLAHTVRGAWQAIDR